MARILKALDLASGEEIWRTEGVGLNLNSLWVGDGVAVATLPSDVRSTIRPVPLGPEPQAAGYAAEDGALLWERRSAGMCHEVSADPTY